VNSPTGIVKVNQHTLELPEEEARTLFLTAVAMSRKSGALAISPDTTVVVNQASQVSIIIPSGFADEYNPQAALSHLTSGRSAAIG
jgi:hypothetical protein